MQPSNRLRNLGLELPPVPNPVAAYVPAIISGNLVRTSGQLPVKDGKITSEGRCGTESVTPEQAYQAARQAALNALAAAAAAAGGVDNLARVVKVTGYVASTPDFFDQPTVVNGASDLFQEVFQEPHARAAVGVAALPLNVTVEIEAEFEVVAPTAIAGLVM